jgi:hypothetical protein
VGPGESDVFRGRGWEEERLTQFEAARIAAIKIAPQHTANNIGEEAEEQSNKIKGDKQERRGWGYER